MAGFKWASPSLLAVLLCIAFLLESEASIYDPKRGLKTQGLSHDQIKEVMKQHDPHHIIHKHKHKDGLKEHPEVKRFQEWHDKFKAGHPDAGVAFAGKIPHDVIPHLFGDDAFPSEPAPEQQQPGAPQQASQDELPRDVPEFKRLEL
ncbi:hypothetical protein GPECTOR_1g686 [Gonium pectorale]|uniref:Cathepsin propeptide inhibitor domain-containing protein n=1 Tax=Gonium pectorale TaxID=33097 RepID=A0A150H3X8_GONPE|nr:hypothetical protein GPECTOR_1g686 [Gonium pectorale]|eukprot:KXZ56761.1 hypothetical protein GPECTOR_1g686 [Gonium pectorale]